MYGCRLANSDGSLWSRAPQVDDATLAGRALWATVPSRRESGSVIVTFMTRTFGYGFLISTSCHGHRL